MHGIAPRLPKQPIPSQLSQVFSCSAVRFVVSHSHFYATRVWSHMQSALRVRSSNTAVPGTISAGTRHISRKPNFPQTRASSTSTPSNEPPLSWPEYLAIRKGKRRWEMVGITQINHLIVLIIASCNLSTGNNNSEHLSRPWRRTILLWIH